MMAKPIGAHPTIQFLIIIIILLLSTMCTVSIGSVLTSPSLKEFIDIHVWTSVYYGDISDNKLCCLNIHVTVYFSFSFVLNSLAYITIPKNNGKIKIN